MDDKYISTSSTNRVESTTTLVSVFQSYLTLGPTYPPKGKYRLKFRFEVGSNVKVRIVMVEWGEVTELFCSSFEESGICMDYKDLELEGSIKYLFVLQFCSSVLGKKACIQYGAMYLDEVVEDD